MRLLFRGIISQERQEQHKSQDPVDTALIPIILLLDLVLLTIRSLSCSSSLKNQNERMPIVPLFLYLLMSAPFSWITITFLRVDKQLTINKYSVYCFLFIVLYVSEGGIEPPTLGL